MRKSSHSKGFRGGKIPMLFLLTFLFFSCGPIKRHNRIVEKYPFVHTQDSVIIRDTIREIIPKIEVDSVFNTMLLYDTIRIEKERLKIQMYAVHDSIYLDAKCDTIEVEKIIEKKIPIRYYKTERSWLKWIIVISIILFTLYAIFRNRD